MPRVVSYSISTSNHNCLLMRSCSMPLYLIPFLHQTTTACAIVNSSFRLYLIPFLHQTTTRRNETYIRRKLYLIPFLHQTTTGPRSSLPGWRLYLIPFLHQTTTRVLELIKPICCILFHFYIKPQPMAHKVLFSSTLSPKSHSHFQRNAVVWWENFKKTR